MDGRSHGRPATVHAEGCGNAGDRAHPLGTTQALDALARPGTTAPRPAWCAMRPRRCCRSSPTATCPTSVGLRPSGTRCSRGDRGRVRRRASPGTAPSRRARPRRPGG
ncbi:DUF6233 domain-containing protein [Streptomyces sp. NPDC092307]|uniref:DUF6233 domain-containing protein n=1 Tax=Streptomyces sp. NPDC092307 TaxID=3366013 RepID=UPI00380B3831